MGINSALGSSALLPAGLGFRNVLINGGFNINQRAFTSTTADNTFGFDRWFCFMSGATTTYSTQAFAVGNAISGQEPTNHARVVSTISGVGDYSILAQKIEDVRTCAGQRVTVSFWAKAASGTPSIAVELVQSFGSGGSAEVNGSNGGVTAKVAITTSWARYSITGVIPSISGKTVGTSSWLGCLLWTSAGSNYNVRTGSIGIQNNTIDFWGVQLEQNYQPTPFEQRPIGVELALCQRYYYRYTGITSGGYARIPSLIGSTGASGAQGVMYNPVPLRTLNGASSIESFQVSVSDNLTFDSGYGTLSLNAQNSSANTTFIAISSIAGTFTQGLARVLVLTTTAGYIGVSAEL